MINCDTNWLLAVTLQHKLYHAPLAVIVRVGDFIAVLVLIEVLADGYCCEECLEVLQRDEEHAIYFVFTVDLRPSAHRPVWAVVAPFAVPLLHAKRITNFDKISLAKVIKFDCLGTDQRVRGILVKTVLM